MYSNTTMPDRRIQADLFANADSPFQGPLPDAVRDVVLDVLRNRREALVDAANEAINVPFISESTERKLIDALYGALLEGAEKVL
jgi:hypothetical protein